MGKTNYQLALKLSRNFTNRSVEETKVLYNVIQKAVGLAQRKGKTKSSQEAIDFLVVVYEPYIKKVAGKFYQYVSSKLDFGDLLQETYAMFLVLLYRYDKTIASFSYYINYFLPQNIYVLVQKFNTDTHISVDVNSIEGTIGHPELDKVEKVFDQLNAKILEQEYVDFIIERSKKSSRSATVKHVCLKIFLGNTSCSQLSSELGISYHAVYEIVNKIKKELKYFFHENKFSDYVISSTGIEELYTYDRYV